MVVVLQDYGEVVYQWLVVGMGEVDVFYYDYLFVGFVCVFQLEVGFVLVFVVFGVFVMYFFQCLNLFFVVCVVGFDVLVDLYFFLGQVFVE